MKSSGKQAILNFCITRAFFWPASLSKSVAANRLAGLSETLGGEVFRQRIIKAGPTIRQEP